MINWVKRNKKEFVVIFVVLLLAAFLRFYRLPEYMTFLGDEGRDVIVVKKILTQFDFPLLGPPTSIGNMYLGPLYYYMMSVSMAIWWLNPVAAAMMVALIGTATVGLIYYLSREWFGKWAAFCSSVLYSLSPLNIMYSRSSWNPNPAPFFALLSILGFYLARKYKNFYFFVLTGVSLAFVIQMHYLALILVFVFGWLWLYELRELKVLKSGMKNFWKGTILSIICFLLLMSPLVIFDLKYNFMNFKAVSTFFTNRETTVNLNILSAIGRIPAIFNNNLISRYMTGGNMYLAILVLVLITVPLLWQAYKLTTEKKNYWPIYALTTWIVIGILGLSLYKQTIYDHYLGFLNPVPYLFLGGVFRVISAEGKSKKKILRWSLVIFCLILAIVNLQQLPLFTQPNNQLKRTQEIAKFVIEKSGGKPFNFALIAEHNYDAAYQFYLDIFGHKPKQVPLETTGQLFVVCEDKVCSPVGHPKYEIAAFGWTKVEYEQEYDGVKIYKLVHNEEQNKQ